MKYFLVEVKKTFGIYPLKAQMVMREKLVNGIFKKNVKVLKELKAKDLKKEYNTEVKYKIEEKEKNVPNPNLIEDVIKKIGKVKTIKKLEEFNYETEELKEAIDSKRAELENNNADGDDKGTNDTNTNENEKDNAGGGKTSTDDKDSEGSNDAEENTDGNDVKTTDDVDFEDMTTEELLKICKETYKMNKPSNTGRPNLLASLKEITKK